MAPSIRLPSDRPSALAQSFAKLRQVKGLRDLRKWTLKSFPLPDLPLRIRPVRSSLPLSPSLSSSPLPHLASPYLDLD